MTRQEFFRSIFGEELLNEWIEVRFIAPKEEGAARRDPRLYFAPSLEELDRILALDDGTTHVYYGIALRKQQRGRKEDVSRARTLWADMDDDKYGSHSAALDATRKLVLPPSILVDSGHGFHAYWLLKDWLDPASLEAGCQAIQRHIASCPVCDCSRIFRVPGTTNVKDGARVPCEIVRMRPELRYTLADILCATRILDKERALILSAATLGFKSRSERDWAVIVALLRLGMSEEAIRIIFKEQPVGDKYRDEGDGYLNTTLAKARERTGMEDKVSTPVQQLISEEDDTYLFEGATGLHQVSTFVLDPKRLFVSRSKDVDAFLVDIRSGGRTWSNIMITKTAFHSMADIHRELPSVYWQWLGSDREVRFLLPYLVGRWEAKGFPTAEMTSIIGRHGDIWVGPNGVLSSESEMDTLSAPIVFQASGREAPDVEYITTIPDAEYLAIAQRVAQTITRVNKPEVIWPALGWTFAAAFKPVLQESAIRFPALNLTGSRGSGKTSLVLKALLPLCGYKKPSSYDCSTTHFVLMSLLDGTNAVPVYLTEFRRSTLTEHDYATLKRILLQMYDVGHDARGKSNQTTVTYELAAPIILDGEDTIQDGAILERMVVVRLDPATIVEGTDAYTAFMSLTAGDVDLHYFAGRYVQYTLGWEPEDVHRAWESSFEEIKNAFGATLPDRLRRNMATSWFGVHQYCEYMHKLGIEIAMPSIEVLRGSLENAVETALGRTVMAVDEFVTDIVLEFAMHPDRAAFICKYDVKENTLWFHLTSTYSWWLRKRRAENQPSVASAALKAQLKERSSETYVGPGQYMLNPKAHYVEGSTKWLYGISVEQCVSSGLDVPSNVMAQLYLSLPVKKEVTSDSKSN